MHLGRPELSFSHVMLAIGAQAVQYFQILPAEMSDGHPVED